MAAGCVNETEDRPFKVAASAVPNDTTNEARALLLLQDNGYLTLQEGVELVDALKSDAIKDYINTTYNGAVIPYK